MVQRAEAEAFAEENGLMYIEASAKSAAGVDDAFIMTATSVWEKLHNGKLSMKTEVRIYLLYIFIIIIIYLFFYNYIYFHYIFRMILLILN
jgi:hypothetical protein